MANAKDIEIELGGDGLDTYDEEANMEPLRNVVKVHHSSSSVHVGGGGISSDDDEGESKDESLSPLSNDSSNKIGPTPNYRSLKPYPWSVYKEHRKLVKDEILSGFTVAFAQIPESIAFSFLAGIDPIVGLNATWIIGLIMSCFGSRFSIIGGFTGARASVVAGPLAMYGTSYLPGIVVCSGIWQILLTYFGAAKLVKLIGRPHMVGFLNGLALVIGLSQLHAFQENQEEGQHHIKWRDGNTVLIMICLAAISTLLVHFVPKYTKALPSSLIAIIVVTSLEHLVVRLGLGLETPLIKDVGNVTASFPILFFLNGGGFDYIPGFTWENIQICGSVGFVCAVVGMLECTLTSDVVDKLTNTPRASKWQILTAMGFANLVAGLLGTGGGGSMIGLSTINCHSGATGRFRISGIVTALTVFLAVMVAYPMMQIVPTASLVGIMVIVVVHTFNFDSVAIIFATLAPKNIREKTKALGIVSLNGRKIHRGDAFVILLVTIVTIFYDLFLAIAGGIFFSALQYAWDNCQRISYATDITPNGDKVYHLRGPIFFGTVRKLHSFFTPKSDPKHVIVYLNKSQIFDYSGMHALDVIGGQYRELNKTMHVIVPSQSCTTIMSKAEELLTNITFNCDISSFGGTEEENNRIAKKHIELWDHHAATAIPPENILQN